MRRYGLLFYFVLLITFWMVLAFKLTIDKPEDMRPTRPPVRHLVIPMEFV